MMHKISVYLKHCDCYFTPYYCDGYLRILNKANLLDFTVVGRQARQKVFEYAQCNGLKLDVEGTSNDYDLIVTCSDLVIQKNIKSKKIILVQEGMTDPENVFYYLAKWFKFPRYFASTSTSGLSHAYKFFCVASYGYKDMFSDKGVDAEKIVVTGIPNFDNSVEFLENNFPLRHYVLAATSDSRETFKYENRKKFIKQCIEIADGRQLVFKLHPNEKYGRAAKEIEKYAPGSLIFHEGNASHMVANCDVLITRYSSVVYLGLALRKEVHSYFNINELRKQLPLQNGGISARNIAEVCRLVLDCVEVSADELSRKFSPYEEPIEEEKLIGSLANA